MASPMVPPGPGMAGQGIVPSSSGQMHPRIARPSSQTGTDMDAFNVCDAYVFENATTTEQTVGQKAFSTSQM